ELTIDGPEGQEFAFTANLVLSSAGLPDEPDAGPQGWSCAIWHAAIDLIDISVAGTVSALESDGGLRVAGEDGSFLFFETLDRSRNEGRRGAIVVTILSQVSKVALPPNTRQVIARLTYSGAIGKAPRVAFFRYENGLEGSGEPVNNIVTVRGQSRFPSLGTRDIVIGKGATPEAGEDACLDGVDNDGDTWIDELDPGCEVALGGEDCLDGIDNDDDGLVDCDDPTCSRSGSCREVCGDGRDNDGDGLTDCDDAECLGRGDCPDPEDCVDGVDNDGDGAVDCDDAQCAGAPECRVREDCGDGVDNDGDGDTDCDDSECVGIAPCPEAERCGDGVDNDQDGDTDCDDRDCAAVSACLTRENCLDGIDNDLDGRVDCDDRDCGGVRPCPPLELCDGGVDEDGDGLVDCQDPNCADQIVCGGVPGFDLVVTAAGDRREAGEGDAAGERNVLHVAPRSGLPLEVVVYFVPVPGPRERGVQGWSIAVRHDREFLTFEEATIDGTDAMELINVGFVRTEAANASSDPRRPGDRPEDSDGFLSAVVLSFTENITLDPSVPQSVARARYRLGDRFETAGEADSRVTLLEFEDGLLGRGQPVNNVLTIGGQTVNAVHRVGLELRPGLNFVRGDPNEDGRVDIADAVWIVSELFRGGPTTRCRLTADVDDDGRIDLTDPILLMGHQFLGGRAPPPPFPGCGTGSRTAVACVEGSPCP
ncbi:MAG: dockerin type I domain-containing protein, partial [Planctomycetota bacterium]|nr:dockerin type I domain-containing protein [Planctomycetota bacterium]